MHLSLRISLLPEPPVFRVTIEHLPGINRSNELEMRSGQIVDSQRSLVSDHLSFREYPAALNRDFIWEWCLHLTSADQCYSPLVVWLTGRGGMWRMKRRKVFHRKSEVFQVRLMRSDLRLRFPLTRPMTNASQPPADRAAIRFPGWKQALARAAGRS